MLEKWKKNTWFKPWFNILLHAQSIVCAENVKSWCKSWVFHFTFQAYILPHTLNCICVSLFKFHIWILEQFQCCQKRPALPRHTKYEFHFNCLEHSICISLTQMLLFKFVPGVKILRLFIYQVGIALHSDHPSKYIFHPICHRLHLLCP